MKTTALDSTSNNLIKSTEWIQMMSSSLLYHKNYLCPNTPLIDKLSPKLSIYQLDTLGIYFREKVCVFLCL